MHLLGNAVHPSEAPDEHDRICSTLNCNCSTPKWSPWCIEHDCFYSTLDAVQPSEAPDVHDSICSTPVWQIQYTKWGSWFTWQDMQYTWWQMQYIQVGLLKYSMASAVQLMANVVHPSFAPDIRWLHIQYIWWQIVHPSEAPEVHDGPCSTLYGKSSAPVGKCSTPKWGSWWTW